MRNHPKEPFDAIGEDDGSHGGARSAGSRALGNHDEFRCSRPEIETDYYRDSLMNVEDQVKTSKLVLQLVTESRFNMTQINGQRKLGGPPPGWKGPAPGPGCEVFVGKIPRTLYEHEIYPIFRKMGEVYEIRLMMDFSGTNRGYCFVMFGLPEFAQRAIRELDNFEIRPGRRIGVVASINNCRLYVGQLPTQVTSETVIRKIYEITDDVGQVSVYRNANDQARYALISYRTHRGAAMARRRLVPERASLFGGAEVSIDWAHPSMFPSNVVEDTGMCDDRGNIDISRLVVGNENKRYQNRRRARDDFLDHNIRAYLQADRALEQTSRNKQNKQNGSQNQSLNSNSLDSVGRDLINFHIFDQNPGNSNSQNYCQRVYSRPEKRGSRESSSSFDLNGGSGSSESSGCSSQSSASDRNRENLSRELSDPSVNGYVPSQSFYPIKNDENISGKHRSSSDSSDQKALAKHGPDSLNLFDNYTFSASSQEQSDFEDQAQDTGADVFLTVFENRSGDNEEDDYGGFMDRGGGNSVPKSCRVSDIEGEVKFDGENEQMLVMWHRDKNGDKSAARTSKSSDFEELESFSKVVGPPLKSRSNCFGNSGKSSDPEIVKDRKDSNLGSKPGSPIKHNRSSANHDWRPIPVQSVSHLSNLPRSQNRNGITPLVRNKNNKNSAANDFLIQQHGDFFNAANRSAGYLPDFNHGTNSNANCKRAWLSAQLAINACDFPDNRLAPNSNNAIVYLDSEIQSGLIPQVIHVGHGHSVASFAQNNRSQNKKNYSAGKNGPKSGRPILSRSWAGRCDEK